MQLKLAVIFLTIFLLVPLSVAFDYSNNFVEQKYMSDDYDEIIRFDGLEFENKKIKNDDLIQLKKISQKIKNYIDDGKVVSVSIVGHSSNTDENSSFKISEKYALDVKKYLSDKGVSEDIMEIEYKGNHDQLYTDATKKGKNLSNRVMVSLYITMPPKPTDLDGDGILSDVDECPDTKKGVLVNEKGCRYGSIVALVEGHKKSTSIVVKTQKGSVVVDKFNQFSAISKDSAPTAPKDLSKKELDTLFSTLVNSSEENFLKYVFYFDNINLLKKSKTKLDEMLGKIANMKNPYIKIIGHTDTKGNALYNEKLGLRRAKVVAKIIKNAKLQILKLEVESYGENDLSVKTPDDVNEKLNRRVEVFIH